MEPPDRPLFVANDICALLGIKNPWDAVAKLESYERDYLGITDAIGRIQQTTVLTEAGLYSLIGKSTKKEAKEFKRWVNTEVLPSIRKTGQYDIQDTIDRQRLDELEASVTEIRLIFSH